MTFEARISVPELSSLNYRVTPRLSKSGREKEEKGLREESQKEKRTGKKTESRRFANSAYLWFPPKVSMRGSGSSLGNRVPQTGTWRSGDKGKYIEIT